MVMTGIYFVPQLEDCSILHFCVINRTIYCGQISIVLLENFLSVDKNLPTKLILKCSTKRQQIDCDVVLFV